jgi:hypothetical protein
MRGPFVGSGRSAQHRDDLPYGAAFIGVALRQLAPNLVK